MNNRKALDTYLSTIDSEKQNRQTSRRKTYFMKVEPWLLWLSGLSASLKTKGSPVCLAVRAHAWVVGQVPSGGCARGNHTLKFLSLSKNK